MAVISRVVASLLLPIWMTTSSVSSLSVQDSYANARNVRLQYGHDAAVPLYQEILRQNPNDITAATRIAANHKSPARHDAACCLDSPEKIHQLRQLLQESNYDNVNIQKMFGISQSRKLAFCSGPVYVTPASAGSVVKEIDLIASTGDNTSLQCLVSLFLLGLSGMFK